MPSALPIMAEVAGSATALAGLVLVFLGALATAYDSYQPQEKNSVKARYQKRVWFAFAGFVLALLSACFALFAKWFSNDCSAIAAVVLMVLALIFVLIAAYSAVREIK